jgi:DNA-binding beta-propeller fold protein YncE
MTIPDIVEGVSGDSELSANIAVDGLGNIFLLGSFNGSVFAYDAQGTFKNRFGSQGTEEGQFRALQDIAIDPQGRVLVGDIFGIYVFEPDGRQAGFITLEGVPFGMAFDSDGYLWVTNRSTVFKMQVNE